MSTYFGHKPKNKMHNFGMPRGGPLAPPTPVKPRPGSSLGGGYNKYVLPGPGPKAGGRYNIYGPGSPTGFKTPRTGPAGRLGPVVDSPFAKSLGNYGRMRNLLGAFGPVGRAINLAGYAMDLWSTTQEEIPGGQFYPFNMPASGYTDLKECDPVGGPVFIPGIGYSGPDTVIRGAAADPNLPCTVVAQRYEGTFNPLTGTWVGTPWAGGSPWISTGPDNQSPVGRMQIRRQWLKTSPGPMVNGPWQDPAPVPAVVQPIPGTATPPAPWTEEQGFPGEGRKTDAHPAPYVEPKTGPKGGPNGRTPVPQLPQLGEEKWVIHDGLIGQIYGWITEMKDALDCLEANMQGYHRKSPNVIRYEKRKPPKALLHQRAIRAAVFLYENPNDIDWKGFGECIQEENLKDSVIGTANKLANRITKSPYWVRPVGVGRGAFAQRF